MPSVSRRQYEGIKVGCRKNLLMLRDALVEGQTYMVKIPMFGNKVSIGDESDPVRFVPMTLEKKFGTFGEFRRFGNCGDFTISIHYFDLWNGGGKDMLIREFK